MRLLGRGKIELHEAHLVQDAQAAISESERVNKRVERIVDEYIETEQSIVRFRKARRGIA